MVCSTSGVLVTSLEDSGTVRTPTSRDICQEENIVGGAPNTGSNPSVALTFYLGAYFGIKVAVKELKDRKAKALAECHLKSRAKPRS